MRQQNIDIYERDVFFTSTTEHDYKDELNALINFELVVRSAWGLSSPGKQVARSSTPCQNGAKFGVQKVNGGQDICSRDASVGNGKNCENMLSPLRVKEIIVRRTF